MPRNAAKRGLSSSRKPFTYTGPDLSRISFPLGGVGTGCIGLEGSGGLRDWQIFHRPNISPRPAKTFPAIWAKEKGKEPVCRVLEGPLPAPYGVDGGGGPHHSGEGFPHMDGATFRGEFPFAWIDFASRALPVKVALEAWSPFIPSEADDSSFPAAVLTYTVTNTAKNPVDCTVVWSMLNQIGSIGIAERDKLFSQVEYGMGQNVNESVDRDGLRGLVFSTKKWPEDHPRFGTMALLTPEKRAITCKQWLRGGWFAPMHEFWDTFSATGELPEHDYGPSDDRNTDAGSVGVKLKLKPGESKTATFYIAWHFPTFEKYWHAIETEVGQVVAQDAKRTAKPAWKHHYATLFSDAFDVVRRLHTDRARLHNATQTFHDALFASTLPPSVLDAVSANLAILRSPTVTRLQDGSLYGFEGCADIAGCCEGSCTHVWNYQQATAFLFPDLERSLRTNEYEYCLRDDGGVGFRLQLPLGAPPTSFIPCGDGQMGGIVKLYRDWKISGDDAWLRKLWPNAKKALEYAWSVWDKDKTGVMTGPQHNTYDIEFYGPNPMMTCFYLGALVAAAEIADYLGDTKTADEYRRIFERGSRWVDENLWNGEFYIQQYDPKEAPVHQYGAGCLSDQLLGQWSAMIAGLGYVLDPSHVRRALKSTFKYNWKANLKNHENAQRVYALNDEAGLILCSWPHGGRPAVPFVYSDEVWTGIEYQVASHLIMEGMVDEGLTVVQGVRDRFDGFRRNPYDEYECGHYYARAMASYGLLNALSGFSFDKGLGVIGFAPQTTPGRFACFWALDGVWGVYARKGTTATVAVLHGDIALSRLDLPGFITGPGASATLGRQAVKAVADDVGSLTFARTVKLKAGQSLTITI